MCHDEQENRAADSGGGGRKRDGRQEWRAGGRPPADDVIEAEEPDAGHRSRGAARQIRRQYRRDARHQENHLQQSRDEENLHRDGQPVRRALTAGIQRDAL